jgi:molecular chaperone DnaJ
MSKDYYQVLGVEKTATQDDIKAAFRKAAHKYHPDKSTGDEAKFKEANEAYQVLGNADKRRQYDQFGSTFSQGGFGNNGGGYGGFSQGGFNQGGFNINMDDLGDIFGGFGDIFGFGGGGKKKPTSQRGNDLEMIATISFEEAVFGAEKEIRLTKSVKCETCNGSGAHKDAKVEICSVCKGSGHTTTVKRTILGNVQMQTTCEHCNGEGRTVSKYCSVCNGGGIVRTQVNLKIKIPAGINNHESLRLSGEGEAGQKGGPAGDLYVRIRVSPSKQFEREGINIISNLEISMSEAALGAKKDVATIHGDVSLKIPAGTESGRIFMLRGKGVVKLQGHGQGDHLVHVIVRIPSDLSRKQRKLLEELQVEGL